MIKLRITFFVFCFVLQKVAFIVALAIASVAAKPDVSHLKDGYEYDKPGCGIEGCGYDYPKPDVPFELPTETTKPPNTYVPPPPPPPPSPPPSTYLPPV